MLKEAVIRIATVRDPRSVLHDFSTEQVIKALNFDRFVV